VQLYVATFSCINNTDIVFAFIRTYFPGGIFEMRLEAAFLGGLFTIGGLCNLSPDADGFLHRRHVDIHEQMRREADAAVHQHAKRTLSTADVFGQPGGVWPTVTVPSGFTLAGGVELTPIPGMPTSTLALAATPTAAPLLANGSIDTTQWNAEAHTACMNAMDMLNGNSSNPTGLVACYNLPYLDQTNGTFEAELRIFNVSMPTGQWVGVTTSQMTVALSFQGATIQPSNGLVPVKRNMDSQPLLRRQMTTTSSMMATATSSGAMMTPSQVALRTYVGQIYQNQLTPGMNR
jgi:flagellar basal body rod protein FlgF